MAATIPGDAFEPNQLPIEFIPELFRFIAHETGTAPLFRLMKEFGGTPIQVPSSSHLKSRLRSILGDKAFKIVTYHFAGDRIYIPKFPNEKVIRTFRNTSIRQDRDKGMPVRAIAVKYGLSDRSIRKITNSPEE